MLITGKIFFKIRCIINRIESKLINFEQNLRRILLELRYFYKKVYTQEELQTFADMIANRLGCPKVPVYVNNGGSFYVHGHAVYIDQYQLFAYNDMSIEMCVAHEMRHHFQCVSGRLKADMFSRTWDDKRITKTYWYTDPSELDAVEYENQVALELKLPIKRIVINNELYELKNTAYRQK